MPSEQPVDAVAVVSASAFAETRLEGLPYLVLAGNYEGFAAVPFVGSVEGWVAAVVVDVVVVWSAVSSGLAVSELYFLASFASGIAGTAAFDIDWVVAWACAEGGIEVRLHTSLG